MTSHGPDYSSDAPRSTTSATEISGTGHSPVWYPPQFPEAGRLPRQAGQVARNIHRQESMERDYQDALSIAANYRVTPPCCKTLHISLCFDGTGNNLNNDLLQSEVPHPTNIARLFRACIGDGIAGGTTHQGDKARGLIDNAGVGLGSYFKYYMPGVGTPFPEMGDLDYSTAGLASAWFGEERVNWGLLMIIDAIRRTLDQPPLATEVLSAAVKSMGTWPGFEGVSGQRHRLAEFTKQLSAIEAPLRYAVLQPTPGVCKLLGIKLYVYGFSRGAAAARAFVSWLDELMRSRPTLSFGDLEIPITVEYLGILDTVASVGIADIVPGARGHMGWADGNQQLPASGLVKRCLHLVAAHEQRVSFPLESIRRQTGDYPPNCIEVIYPGVHSDLGGGYLPGDQGKGGGRSDGSLVSQIALHDLYADAFAHGAPLKVEKRALGAGLHNEHWRVLEDNVVLALDIDPTLVSRFNAWRQVTVGLASNLTHQTDVMKEQFEPILADTSLERALRVQLAWITAWRIDRYAFTSLINTSFYKQATDSHSDPLSYNLAKKQRDDRQVVIEDQRKLQVSLHRPGSDRRPFQPGIPTFDPDLARTQLREAAEEFAKAYRNDRLMAAALNRLVPAYGPPAFVARIITANVYAEALHMKASGREKVSRLFPPFAGYRNHVDENIRGEVDEYRNASMPEGLLRDLFDDQVHDSRAWFLHSFGREPMGSYFRERMVFFGTASRREVAIHGEIDTSGMAYFPRDPEHIARAQQAINARWAAFHAQLEDEAADDLA